MILKVIVIITIDGYKKNGTRDSNDNYETMYDKNVKDNSDGNADDINNVDSNDRADDGEEEDNSIKSNSNNCNGDDSTVYGNTYDNNEEYENIANTNNDEDASVFNTNYIIFLNTIEEDDGGYFKS